MRFVVAVAIMFLSTFYANAQLDSHSKLTSKQAWKEVFEIMKFTNNDKAITEQEKRDFWERGLVLWGQYPDDDTRYEWLSWAGSRQRAVRFYLDPVAADSSSQIQREKLPIDTAAKRAWEKQYMALRAEFFNDQRVAEKDKANFWHYELFHKTLSDAKKAVAYRGEKIDTEKLAAEVYNFYSRYPWYWDKSNNAFLYFTLFAVDEFGLRAPQDMLEFLRQFKTNPNRHLVSYVSGYEQVLRLYTEPFELRFTALEDGQKVDLKNYRGKVVFLDMWNTGCFSCIQAMPKYQKLYEKYRPYGFEVVGLCLDTDDNKKRALDVIDKTGTTWPTYFSGGSKDDYDQKKGPTGEFMGKYGITGFPFRLLLDGDGKLIAQQPAHDRLELILREELGLPPL